MKQFGLLGYPLSHSFSKKYYEAKFEKENINDCEYFLFSIPKVSEVANLLQTHKNLHGFNVTIPHKKEIISLLTDKSNLPIGLDACNCIQVRDGKLIGFNTDVIGFEKSLNPLINAAHSKALVLGNGGAADAVRYVLQKKAIKYKTVGRMASRGIDLLYEDLDDDTVNEHKLIINCTPLGTFPNTQEYPLISFKSIGKEHLLYDLIYNPEKTKFLQKGEANGAAIKNGYEMLLIQAEENWRIWNA